MELLLNKNELLDLGKNISGLKITCAAGCFWITQSGDNRDHFVKAGQSFSVKSSGQLVIVALQPGRLLLDQAKSAQPHISSRLVNEFCRGILFASN